MGTMKFSPRTSAAVFAAGTLAFTTACSSDTAAAPGEGGGEEGAIEIVTSTSIWGDVAQAVADTATGANVTVTPIITGNAVDPHSFEPTAADIARADEADIVVAGGGGYDAWLYEPLSDQDKVIAPLPLIGHSHDHDHGEEGHDHEAHDHEGHDHEGHDHEGHDHEGAEHESHEHGEEGHEGEHSHEVEMLDGNEHIWYDTTAITVVAEKVAEQINAAVPEAGANADAVIERVDSLHERIHELPELNYVQSESIADYITSHAPMEDVTPESYRMAILNHAEPSAADLAELLDTIKGGDVSALIYNPQTKTDLTERILAAAEEADLQVVEIGETPPEDTNFLDYYDQVLGELEALNP
ncbi:high-affinity zinc transporter periplasmic component [Corynebacterium endometrii]|uniref:High-affinity zinc transporter periplasmic component n=2 Tax=Corynebacterium endometrii TaxID=2488819 RepID=A0A4P7QI29_9CORY|nr:high-affinity zinc transporter periplasmic component [Corynebacterium endometrii]